MLGKSGSAVTGGFGLCVPVGPRGARSGVSCQRCGAGLGSALCHRGALGPGSALCPSGGLGPGSAVTEG